MDWTKIAKNDNFIQENNFKIIITMSMITVSVENINNKIKNSGLKRALKNMLELGMK